MVHPWPLDTNRLLTIPRGRWTQTPSMHMTSTAGISSDRFLLLSSDPPCAGSHHPWLAKPVFFPITWIFMFALIAWWLLDTLFWLIGGTPWTPALLSTSILNELTLFYGVNTDPWVRKIPWRRKWQPTPVFLPGKLHGQKNLTGYGL